MYWAYLSGFRVPPEEVKGEGTTKVEVQGLQDDALHFPDVWLSVGVVGDIDKVGDLWGIHLLVLRGQQHGGYTNQLEFAARHLLSLECRKPFMYDQSLKRDRVSLNILILYL